MEIQLTQIPQSVVAHHISEPAPLAFDDLVIIPSSQTQGDTLFLLSDDASPLLAADTQYLLLTEAGTDGLGMTALDSFENTFGSYTYPQ